MTTLPMPNSTDEEGIYTLETRDTVGRVQASMVGYATQTKPLTRGGFNQVDFALEAVEFGIGAPLAASVTRPRTRVLCADRVVHTDKAASSEASSLYVILPRCILQK